MKLIHDCVRDVMLYIEENLQDNRTISTSAIANDLSKYSLEDIKYTCKKLNEARYLEISNSIGGGIAIISMSYNGHIFLDSIRDDGVWKETKSKVSKIASVSLPILQQVAATIITNKLGI